MLAVGITEVQAAQQPRVGIVSQGDEVVPPEQEPGPGQVRDVNSYTLAGYVRRAGAVPLTYPIAPDTQAAIDAAVRRAFEDADVVVMIFREDMYEATEENQGVAELIIAKQRNGPTGTARLAFIREFTRFENLEWRGGPA